MAGIPVDGDKKIVILFLLQFAANRLFYMAVVQPKKINNILIYFNLNKFRTIISPQRHCGGMNNVPEDRPHRPKSLFFEIQWPATTVADPISTDYYLISVALNQYQAY